MLPKKPNGTDNNGCSFISWAQLFHENRKKRIIFSEIFTRKNSILTKSDVCPNCSLPTSKRWQGYVIVRDPVRSQIAQKMNITKAGKYALKVR